MWSWNLTVCVLNDLYSYLIRSMNVQNNPWLWITQEKCENNLKSSFYVLNPAGAYGVVYRARDNTNGGYVALKKIRISITSDGIPMTTLREISLLKHLDSYNHPHIVKWGRMSLILFYVFTKKPFRLLDVIHRRADRDNTLELYLVFEYLERDLADYITHLPSTTLIPTHQIQVRWAIMWTFMIFILSGCSLTETFKRTFKRHRFPSFAQNYS